MKIFISHLGEEAPLALVLKEWIESSFAGQCDVFVSSDRNDLPAGTRWLDQIEAALTDARALIVLCSPRSIARPWVNFETGCAWIKKIPIVPICHSGQLKNDLPAPLSTFQALERDSEEFISALLSSLARHLGISRVPRVDARAMRDELTKGATASPTGEQASKPPITFTLSQSRESFYFQSVGVKRDLVATIFVVWAEISNATERPITIKEILLAHGDILLKNDRISKALPYSNVTYTRRDKDNSPGEYISFARINADYAFHPHIDDENLRIDGGCSEVGSLLYWLMPANETLVGQWTGNIIVRSSRGDHTFAILLNQRGV